MKTKHPEKLHEEGWFLGVLWGGKGMCVLDCIRGFYVRPKGGGFATTGRNSKRARRWGRNGGEGRDRVPGFHKKKPPAGTKKHHAEAQHRHLSDGGL